MAHSPELIKELEEKVDVVRHNILRIFEASRSGTLRRNNVPDRNCDRTLLPPP